MHDARRRDLLKDPATLRLVSARLLTASRLLRQRSRFLSLRLRVQHDRSNDLLTTSRFQRHYAADYLPALQPTQLRLMA